MGWMVRRRRNREVEGFKQVGFIFKHPNERKRKREAVLKDEKKRGKARGRSGLF